MTFERYSDKPVCIGIDTIIMALTGTIYQIAPRYMPRNMNAIVAKFLRAFRQRKETVECLGHYTISGKYNEILPIIQEILFEIPEFQELNLTEREYQYGQAPQDEGKLNVAFTSRYDRDTPLSWYDDFIDLTAVMQNFSRYLWNFIDDDNRTCLDCQYNPKTTPEICAHCIKNPMLVDKFESCCKNLNTHTDTVSITIPSIPGDPIKDKNDVEAKSEPSAYSELDQYTESIAKQIITLLDDNDYPIGTIISFNTTNPNITDKEKYEKVILNATNRMLHSNGEFEKLLISCDKSIAKQAGMDVGSDDYLWILVKDTHSVRVIIPDDAKE